MSHKKDARAKWIYKSNTSDTEDALLDLHLSITNSIVSTRNNDKRDNFDFDIVNFPFLDIDDPRSTSYLNISTHPIC